MHVQTEFQKAIDLENVIRTDAVLARFPFHNLSKRETLEILIEKECEQSEAAFGTDEVGPRAKRIARRLAKYETYWRVSPNAEFGAPRQLAYNIDKLVVDSVLDQVPRPLPKWIRLGTLRSICRELGRGADTNSIRRALLQNSSTYVTMKFTYEDKNGNRRYVADHNTRYGVRFTGETNNAGDISEAVYLSFNEPFRSIINTTKVRPQDRAYLRVLKPAARRFYELTSFVFYAAFKNRRPYGQARYSEYCKHAPQKRLTDRHNAQTQMGKLHRIHLSSGYLAKVQYIPTTDQGGHRDWFIRYWPGPAAKEEYETFCGRGTTASKPTPEVPKDPKSSKRLSKGRIRPDSDVPAQPSLPLARFLVFPRSRRTRKADELAGRLVELCGGDEAMAVYVVERFAMVADETGWRAKVLYFNALFSEEGRYVTEAIEAQRKAAERDHRTAERRAQEEEEQHYDEAAKDWAEREFPELPREEQEELVEEAARKLRGTFPEEHLRRAWGSDFAARLRESARAHAISRYRSRFPVTRDQWLSGVRTADTRPKD